MSLVPVKMPREALSTSMMNVVRLGFGPDHETHFHIEARHLMIIITITKSNEF